MRHDMARCGCGAMVTLRPRARAYDAKCGKCRSKATVPATTEVPSTTCSMEYDPDAWKDVANVGSLSGSRVRHAFKLGDIVTLKSLDGVAPNGLCEGVVVLGMNPDTMMVVQINEWAIGDGDAQCIYRSNMIYLGTPGWVFELSYRRGDVLALRGRT